MRFKTFATCLALLSTPAFAGEAALTLQGQAVYYGLRVPLEVQAVTRNADLSDLQVLNARGEPMAFAWAEDSGESSAQQQHQVPFFKAPQTSSAAASAQQNGWILDLRQVHAALLDLELTLAPGTQGVYAFAIESSADLQQWHSVQDAAQLVSLQHNGLRLENSRFSLDGLNTRYLRLRPLPGSLPPPLSAATVTSVVQRTPVPPVQWSSVLSPSQCTAQYCDYTLPRHLPLERLEWQLSNTNTLAPVQLLVQAIQGESTPTPPRRHLLRQTLAGLRDKTAPAPSGTANPVWLPLHQTTVYWLRLPQGEVRSPPLALEGGLYHQLRIQPVGGMAQLGTRPPTLRVGAHASDLVFLAREPAPYRLAWGGSSPAPALLLAQLMPTRQTNDPLPADTARVQLPLPSVAAPQHVASATPPPTPQPTRKFWLWGVLVMALGLMGFMAWSLLRPQPPVVEK